MYKGSWLTPTSPVLTFLEQRLLPSPLLKVLPVSTDVDDGGYHPREEADNESEDQDDYSQNDDD